MEQSHGCDKPAGFIDACLRPRIDKQTEKARLREAMKQRKVEETRVKAAEAKNRLAAQRVQLQVRHRDILLFVPVFELHICIWTYLKGLSHLYLKPGLFRLVIQAQRLLPPLYRFHLCI